jgi:predicted Zn finger-like uncharacterized protein
LVATCSNCQARFKIADQKVGAKGVKVRCTKCQTIFQVRPEGAVAPAPPAAEAPAKPSLDLDFDLEPPKRPASKGGRSAGLAVAADDRMAAASQAVLSDPFAAVGGEPIPPPRQEAPSFDSGLEMPSAPPDPFAQGGGAQAGAPFAGMPQSPDPFGAASADPFAAASPSPDPFAAGAAAPSADPFAGGAAAQSPDPFADTAASSSRDPFSDTGPSPSSQDPFDTGPPASADPFAQTASDPFGNPVSSGMGDPFAGAGHSAATTDFDVQTPSATGGDSIAGLEQFSVGPDPFAGAGAEASAGAEESLELGTPSPPPMPKTGSPPPLPRKRTAEIPASPLGEEAPADPVAAIASIPIEPVAAAAVAPPPPVVVVPAPAAAVTPKPSSGRASGALRSALSLAALLLVAVGVVLVWRNGGRLDRRLFQPKAVIELLGGMGAADAAVGAVATGVTNGLYETRDGTLLLFVRGEVQSRSKATLPGATVTVELVDGDKVVARAVGRAGAVPTPEDLWADGGHASELEKVVARLGAQAKAITPGGKVPFLVAFSDYPSDLTGLVFRVSVAADGG